MYENVFINAAFLSFFFIFIPLRSLKFTANAQKRVVTIGSGQKVKGKSPQKETGPNVLNSRQFLTNCIPQQTHSFS